jgi:hypothetical protein
MMLSPLLVIIFIFFISYKQQQGARDLFFFHSTCWSIYNFVGVEVASHESDYGKVAPKHVVEDVDWVHEGLRWVCKINGCINNYVVKWLFCHHFDNKHGLHFKVGKFGRPSTHPWGPRQQDHYSMNIHILSNHVKVGKK